MTVVGQSRFYVSNSPFDSDETNIANINAAGYDPTDRERLFFHYNPAAGKVELNPQNNMYGRANKLGANYNFDPAGDYHNATGWFGQGSNQPIKYGGSGLDQALSPATGPGGAMYQNQLRIAIPSKSATPDNIGGFIQCPYGFYQHNNVCVPGVNLDPTRPENILGIDVNRGFQNSRGVIIQVITPVRTELNKLFQVVTKVQNIGQKPGKFFTKISIPSLSLGEVQSNSIFLDAGQQGVVYQSLQMPSSVPPNSLLTVKSDLFKQDLNAPYAEPTPEDTNTATLPNPSTVLGLPPIPPPLPNFPIPPLNPGGRAFAAYEYPQQYQLAPPTYPVPPAIPYMAPRPRYYPMQPFYHNPYPRRAAISIYPPNYGNVYAEKQKIWVSAIGFMPGERVTFTFYSTRNLMGILRFNNKLDSERTKAMYNGATEPVELKVPNNKRGQLVSLVAEGNDSRKVVSIEINVR